jgi:hypothetical protein
LRLASPDFVFGKRGVLGSFWGQIAVNLRAKRAEFAAFRKVMSFIFKYSFASFPLFFISYNVLLSPVHPNHPVFFCAPVGAAPAYDKLSTI